MIIGRKNEIEMLRDAYESELPRHIIHLSGRHYHHLIISVSSVQSVFFSPLKRMLRLCGGTVFQTALLFMVIVPRLRPGLLSLCSVLASSQHSMFVVCKKFSLEASTPLHVCSW